MQNNYDLMLDDLDDLVIVNGDFVIGESILQEVGIIIRLNSGDLKSDPVLGPNLIQLINGKKDMQEFEERVRIHLARDNKNYEDIKKLIDVKTRS